jgi:hypothetical protein
MDGNMVRLSAEYSKSKKARALPLTGALGQRLSASYFKCCWPRSMAAVRSSSLIMSYCR